MSRFVLKADIAKTSVLDYKPPKFELGTPEPAKKYIELKQTQSSSGFRMNDAIRIQTGVAQIEAQSLEESVDGRVLEKLKELQENAYQEAYQLGLEEGRKQAFDQATLEIEAGLQKMEGIVTALTNMKPELLRFNETHLIELAFHMAKRLAAAEIQANPEIVKEIVRQSVEVAQNEQNVTVLVNPTQLEFLETLKKEQGREFEFLKAVKLEPSEQVSVGGCIVQTNYGEIDARFEQRVEKLWAALADNLYRVKDRISVA